MKTGIVMEISKGKAVLLMKDGNFVTYRIPKGKQPEVGHEYSAEFFKDPFRYQLLFPSFSLSLAAVLAFILYNGSLPLSRTEMVAAYVSFDINPSLEVAVGEDLRILNVTAFNKDAEEAVERIGNAKGYTLSEFASELMADYEREGYFNSSHELMIVTARKPKTSASITKKIDQTVQTISKNVKNKHHVVVSSAAAEIKTRNEAKKKGVTAGKYSLYLNARKYKRTLSVKEAENMTVKQLKTAAAGSSKEKKNKDKEENHSRKPHSRKTPVKQNRMKVKIAGPGLHEKEDRRGGKLRQQRKPGSRDNNYRKKSVLVIEKKDHSFKQENRKDNRKEKDSSNRQRRKKDRPLIKHRQDQQREKFKHDNHHHNKH